MMTIISIINGHQRIWRWIALLLISLSLAYPMQSYAGNNGRFQLEFGKSDNKTFQDIAVIFKESGQFQSIIDGLNREFVIPENIKVEFADKEGPLYDPATKTITMSYDYIFYLTTVYLEKYPKANDDAILRFTTGSTTFLFYHELAHSLIDVYHLPIVSSEEAAADNLAVIISLEYTNDGYTIAMDSAELFDLLEETNEEYDDDELWDEHALDSQRFYNIICLTYGRYPERVAKELKELKNEKLLAFIEEKGEYCVSEYERQLQAWLQLLEPHLVSQ